MLFQLGSLVEAVEKRLGPEHDRVVKRLLVNGTGGKDDPTAANILDAIDTLKQAEETDTVLLFIAAMASTTGLTTASCRPPRR
jgi:hypothetical protein